MQNTTTIIARTTTTTTTELDLEFDSTISPWSHMWGGQQTVGCGQVYYFSRYLCRYPWLVEGKQCFGDCADNTVR